MGCYGIGVSRTLAAIVEQHNDKAGICWPTCIAPYDVEIIPLDVHDEYVWPQALNAAQILSQQGIEVLLDDRRERPGVKFNDADLIGLPLQIVFGKRSLERGVCELKIRATGERIECKLDEIETKVKELRAQRSQEEQQLLQTGIIGA